MNEPFEFLDSGDEDTDDDGGLLWIPITIGGLITIALLTIPLLNLLKTDQKAEQEWADFSESKSESIEVNLDSADVDDTSSYSELMTYPYESLVNDKENEEVNLILTNLGDAEGTSSESASPKESKQTRVIPLKQPEVKSYSGKVREITVQQGDTLYGLAKRNDSSADEIAGMNGIKKEDPIQVGQVLSVPVSFNPETVPSNTEVGRPAISKPLEKVEAKPPVNKRVVSQKPTRAPSPPKSRRKSQPVEPIVDGPKPSQPSPPIRPVEVTPLPPSQEPAVAPTLFPIDPPKPSDPENPLDKYDTAIAYRVQSFDNLSRIANAHATTPEELIELNGRSNVKKGEMLLIPVDNCLIKNNK